MNSENPLLIGKGLPPFDKIKLEHIEPAIKFILKQAKKDLSKLEKNAKPSWKELIEPLDKVTENLEWAWSIINHLMSVQNSPELREIYEKLQSPITEFYNDLNQNENLYKVFKAFKNSSPWDNLDSAQQRIIMAQIRDFELSGINLPEPQKKRFCEIEIKLSELGTLFSNNVLDATKAFSLLLTDENDIEGLPESLLSLAAQNAQAEPEKGPWKISLDLPSFLPFMQYSKKPNLREKLYKAYISRASSGNWNNYPLLHEILKLKQEQAKLLGFANYIELSLQDKMADNLESIYEKLEELRQVSYIAAQKELEKLKQFAGIDLKHWDIAFWTEKLREHEFKFSQEELRPYFSFPVVLESLFNLAHRLFKINIIPADGLAPIWHDDIKFFQVNNEKGKAIAYFYLDPYSRPENKSGGAWMNNCIDRAKTDDEIRFPVAYLVCNQMPPIGSKPSLMTFNDVETLFHEFGHGLQHLLTEINYERAAGINNIEWDAVELPSQFMENWCYEEKTLKGMAKHYLTGERLPDNLYKQLMLSKNFMIASSILRQLHFTFLDLELHKQTVEDANSIRKSIADKTLLMELLPEDAFLCSFTHIFSGGYSAGYYSYKWAEILSADAFAAFEEVGLNNETEIAKVGELFKKTVLSLGGSKHPLEIFKMFRNREPSTEALLRHSGLK